VVVQVALSLVLVVGAGLFVRTFASLASLDPGFDSGRVLLVDVDAQQSAVPLADRSVLFDRLRQATLGVPGVAGAATSFLSPLSGMAWNTSISMPHLASLSERQRMAWFNGVSPGFFTTYGTTLIAGRDFTPDDRLGGAPVAIVNEAFVRAYLHGRSPLGQTFEREREPAKPREVIQIVGVVEDASYRSLRDPKPPIVYLPQAQVDDDFARSSTVLAVRAAGTVTLASLTRGIVDAVGRVDRSLSLTMRPLRDQLDEGLIRERIVAALSGFFGALALLIAGIGLYGITAYSVTCRRTEIGVRMALGADASRVLRLVLGRVGRLVVAGVIVGIVLSLWASRFVNSLLYGLDPHDAATLAAAAAVLVAVAIVAAWLPARQAARIDPAAVLREG
jgi:predicted permease